MSTPTAGQERVLLFFGSPELPIRPLTDQGIEHLRNAYAAIASETEVLVPGLSSLAWIEKSAFGQVLRLRVRPEQWRTSASLPDSHAWRSTVWALLGADPTVAEDWFILHPGVLAVVLERTNPGVPVTADAWDSVRELCRQEGLRCLTGLLGPLSAAGSALGAPTLRGQRHPMGYYLFPWPISATPGTNDRSATAPLCNVGAAVSWDELRLCSVGDPDFDSPMLHATWLSLLCGARYGQLRMAVDHADRLAEQLRGGPAACRGLVIPPLEEVSAFANWLDVQARPPSISRAQEHVHLASTLMREWRTRELLGMLRAHARTLRILHRGRQAARQAALSWWGNGLVGLVGLFGAYGLADQVLGAATTPSGPETGTKVLLAFLLLAAALVVLWLMRRIGSWWANR